MGINKFTYGKEHNIEKYKARFVPKGYSQREGFEYHKIYAPIAKLTNFRALMVIIKEENMIAEELDVKNAFLLGNLKDEIYMNPPSGCKYQNGQVCRLR